MRIYFCTLPKAGSQWFRDLLCNEITADQVDYCHRPHRRSDFHMGRRTWLATEEEGLFFGPIYAVDVRFVTQHIRDEDRVFYVLRDPRDLMVSWMYSATYSHVPGAPFIDLIRPVLRAVPPRLRMRLALSRNVSQYRTALSWVDSNDERFKVVRYEDLVEDTAGIVADCYAFTGNRVQPETVQAVVDRLSFAARSGRERGEENIKSHYRKGVAGDWRNYFDREFGEIMESMGTGLLRRLGYAESDDWWQELPETLDAYAEEAEDGCAGGELANQDRRIEELEARNRELQREADARLALIEDLQRTADERLAIIEELHGTPGTDEEGVA